MFGRRRIENRITRVVTPDAVTVAGVSEPAVIAVVDLGHWHGRHQKRWRATEALLRRLADQLTRRALVELRDRTSALDAQASDIEASAGGLRTSVTQGYADGSHNGPFGELFARRQHVQATRDQAQLGSLEGQLARTRAAIDVAEDGFVERVEAVVSGCRLLWSAYRHAYVEAVPGRTDSQRHGPLIPECLNLELPIDVSALIETGPVEVHASDRRRESALRRSDPPSPGEAP